VLVDGQRMTAMANECGRTHVVMERDPALHTWDRQRVPSNCTDGVVDTEVRDLHTPRPSNDELLRVVEIRDAQPGNTTGTPGGVSFVLLNEPGIPHKIGEAAELRSTLAEECGEWSRVMLALASEQAVVLPKLGDGEWRTAAEQSACRDEADERTCRERAAAEPEDVDLVSLLDGSAVLEILDQPVVSRSNVGLEPEAESAAGHLVE